MIRYERRKSSFMIYRKIKVTYYHNNKTGEWCKNAPAKYYEVLR